MTPIELLEQSLKIKYPNRYIALDIPRNSYGLWLLDILIGTKFAIIQWQEDRGFGISWLKDYRGVYGEGCDESYTDNDSVYKRIVTLIEENEDERLR